MKCVRHTEAPLMKPGPKPLEPARRFTILDLLILLVPIALAFSLVRNAAARPAAWAWIDVPWLSLQWLGHALGIGSRALDDVGIVLSRSFIVLRWSIAMASRFIAMGMLGLLIISLRHPRPSRHRLSRSPGFVACAAGAVAMAAGGAIALASALFRYGSAGDMTLWPQFEARIGPAVVAAWALSAESQRPRKEATWLEVAGRACGNYWCIVSGLRLGLALVGVRLTIV
jgi:hypothetical protein